MGGRGSVVERLTNGSNEGRGVVEIAEQNVEAENPLFRPADVDEML